MVNRICNREGPFAPTDDAMPDVRVQLHRPGFYPGQRVAGIVTLNLSHPTQLRGLRIRLTGTEQVQVQFGRQARWVAASTVDQEVVLVGRERLPDVGAVVVDTWDTVLERTCRTVLRPGEYIYPFSIPLPSHAPPSYQGRIARVSYKLELVLDRPLKQSRVISVPFQVLSPGREGTIYPLSLSISGRDSAVNENRARSPKVLFSVELPQQEFSAGGSVTGEYFVENPEAELVEGVVVTLRAREETFAQGGSGSEQWDVVRVRIPFKDITAPVQKGEINLQVPVNVVPSISGRTFTLSYNLEVRLAAPQSSDLTLRAQVGITPPLVAAG